MRTYYVGTVKTRLRSSPMVETSFLGAIGDCRRRYLLDSWRVSSTSMDVTLRDDTASCQAMGTTRTCDDTSCCIVSPPVSHLVDCVGTIRWSMHRCHALLEAGAART